MTKKIRIKITPKQQQLVVNHGFESPEYFRIGKSVGNKIEIMVPEEDLDIIIDDIYSIMNHVKLSSSDEQALDRLVSKLEEVF